MKFNSGQLTVPGLLIIFLTIMVFSALNNTITDATTNISQNLTTRGYVEEGLLAHFIPMFLIVTILASIALYNAPQT